MSAPKMAIGDGAPGFWAAVREIYLEARAQHCWVHKTANVLNRLPTHAQSKAKRDLREIIRNAGGRQVDRRSMLSYACTA